MRTRQFFAYRERFFLGQHYTNYRSCIAAYWRYIERGSFPHDHEENRCFIYTDGTHYEFCTALTEGEIITQKGWILYSFLNSQFRFVRM